MCRKKLKAQEEWEEFSNNLHRYNNQSYNPMKRCNLKLVIISDGKVFKLESFLVCKIDNTPYLLRQIANFCSNIEGDSHLNESVDDFVAYMESVSTVTFFGFDEIITSGEDIVTSKHCLDVAGGSYLVRAVKCVEIVIIHEDRKN